MLMSSEYALSDGSGQTFAFNGAKYVGKQTAMAVLVEGGYVTDKAVLAPWTCDDASKYYDPAVYTPVITKAETLHPYDSEGWNDLTGYEGERSDVPGDTSLCVVSNGGRGFRIDGAASDNVEGWIVLLTSTSKEDSLAMVSYRHAMDLSQGTDLYDVPKNMTKATVHGGIYVNPTYDEVGCIRLSLVGLILPEEAGWKMLRLSPIEVRDGISPAGDAKGGAPTLTPLGGGKPSDDGTDGTPRKRKSKK